jgi:hypothetical protein
MTTIRKRWARKRRRHCMVKCSFSFQRFKRDFNSKNSRDFAHAVAEFGI